MRRPSASSRLVRLPDLIKQIRILKNLAPTHYAAIASIVNSDVERLLKQIDQTNIWYMANTRRAIWFVVGLAGLF